mgnify:CR=1 FL=1
MEISNKNLAICNRVCGYKVQKRCSFSGDAGRCRLGTRVILPFSVETELDGSAGTKQADLSESDGPQRDFGIGLYA